MRKNNKKYLYEIVYASGLLRCTSRQNIYIVSHKKLKEEQFIVVEHINCGVFIGKVVADRSDEEYNLDCVEYRYIKNIDLSDWVAEIKRKERLEELSLEMEEKFAEIDKRKKFEYYAQIDDDFKELYLEYTQLRGKNTYEDN